MKRTTGRLRTADAILTADLHLTDKTPVARIDDYIQAQKDKLMFLGKLSTQNNNCPVLCAGDIFDHWKASPWLIGFAWEYLPRPFICIPGQHDMPLHSLEEFDRSALAVLAAVDDQIQVITNPEKAVSFGNLVIAGSPFGLFDSFSPDQDFFDGITLKQRLVFMMHEQIWQDKKPAWAQGAFSAREVMEPVGNWADLILSGDNHQSFTVEDDDRDTILVNAGSMLRITADQQDFEPQCYLYYAQDNTVEAVDYPANPNVINRGHLDKAQDRDARIAAYIERINQDWEIGLSFRANLEAFFKENSTPAKIQEIIYNALVDK